MLTSTFRVNVGASASSDLDIMTIWDALKGTFGKSLRKISCFSIDLDILMEVRM